MNEYPSIEARPRNEPVYAFDKLDGSCVCLEWRRGKGVVKFGRRHGLLDDSTPILKRAIPLMQALEDSLGRIFKKEQWDKATCYFEFFGPSSFAGNHNPEEEQKVVLFDVEVDKRGIIDPRTFVKLFADRVETPSLLYVGNCNQIFVEEVQRGALEGMTFEGVVCKTTSGERWKVKNRAWIERLKQFCAGDEKPFQTLL